MPRHPCKELTNNTPKKHLFSSTTFDLIQPLSNIVIINTKYLTDTQKQEEIIVMSDDDKRGGGPDNDRPHGGGPDDNRVPFPIPLIKTPSLPPRQRRQRQQRTLSDFIGILSTVQALRPIHNELGWLPAVLLPKSSSVAAVGLPSVLSACSRTIAYVLSFANLEPSKPNASRNEVAAFLFPNFSTMMESISLIKTLKAAEYRRWYDGFFQMAQTPTANALLERIFDDFLCLGFAWPKLQFHQGACRVSHI